MDCCPVVKSISNSNERIVEVMDGLGVVIADNHLGVFGYSGIVLLIVVTETACIEDSLSVQNMKMC